ncbi:MAG TPA: hypothetical protein PLS94_07720 [Prolixibacteraceae bacterium]|nr:hypothetical protein [Prolixibacteraceae bacterium]
MKNLFPLIMLLAVSAFTACSSFDFSNSELGGQQSPMGEVGNEYTVSIPFSGVENASAIVTELEDGISTISYSAKITNPKLLQIVEGMSDVTINNGVASVERKYRITENGYQSVYEEGNLTIVDYNSKVGDTYSLKKDGKTIKREVVSKSTTDDYSWGFFDIKAIKVEETGRNLPGVSKIEFIANHRWGMVGVKIYFEDGTDETLTIFSDASN